uniref:Uncharacterized protein n=1 Tax=Arundo donax TaxID=35708 RepID=A0A0A9FM24_ARUDO
MRSRIDGESTSTSCCSMEEVKALPLNWTAPLMMQTCVLCEGFRSLRSMRL